jgi:hypothetical protein
MNNEPVVWINLDRFKDEALFLADCVSENKVENMGITTPLYTHPAKELTNEEISDIRDEFFAPDGCNIYTFAKALLKKAQEND